MARQVQLGAVSDVRKSRKVVNVDEHPHLIVGDSAYSTQHESCLPFLAGLCLCWRQKHEKH